MLEFMRPARANWGLLGDDWPARMNESGRRVDWPATRVTPQHAADLTYFTIVMVSDPKTNEWNLLKDQFDALAHSKGVRQDNLEEVPRRDRGGFFCRQPFQRFTETA
jgi:hypothetical protein